MSTEAEELHRIISASVRDMLDAYRIQAQAGPVADNALEAILFRAAHPVVNILAPYPAEQRAALLPDVVRMMLATFLEELDLGGEEIYIWGAREDFESVSSIRSSLISGRFMALIKANCFCRACHFERMSAARDLN